jgi:hypothetical protein
MQDLLPETDFRLFAVSVRFPQKLAQQVELRPLREGVYEVRHFTGTLRLVVVHQLPRHEHNAMLHLFSARAELMRYGAEHYRVRSSETSTLLLQLFKRYALEASTMPDALEELARETIAEIVMQLSTGGPVMGVPVADILKRLPAEERLKGLAPEERLKGLSVEEQLAALSPEAREALARQLKGNDSPLNPNPG